MRIFLSLSLSSLLAIAVHAQASSDGNSASSVTASPPLTAPIDDIPPGSFGPHGTFHFLSPSLQYYPPDGTWKTNMLSASVAGESSGNTSVSISTVASGVTWRFSNASVTLLVNGSKPETFNGTTELAASNATVRGLAYGWYNFTLQLNGTGTFSSVEPIFNGSRWLPAKRAKQVQVNATVPSSLFTTAGNWTGEHGLSTNSPGASLNISPPNGTALLELTQDVPSAPGAPFDVSISPPPPMQPAQQSFVSSLYSHDMLFAIGILNVVLFRVELDPKVKYSVNVTYAGNGTDTMVLHNIGAYQSNSEVNNELGASPTPESSSGRLVPKAGSWAPIALLAACILTL